MAVMRSLGASPTPGEVQRHLHLHRIGKESSTSIKHTGLRLEKFNFSAARLRAKTGRLPGAQQMTLTLR